jgi:hypothetical protein
VAGVFAPPLVRALLAIATIATGLPLPLEARELAAVELSHVSVGPANVRRFLGEGGLVLPALTQLASWLRVTDGAFARL